LTSTNDVLAIEERKTKLIHSQKGTQFEKHWREIRTSSQLEPERAEALFRNWFLIAKFLTAHKGAPRPVSQGQDFPCLWREKTKTKIARIRN
jgi:hypothetical protein